MGGIEAVLTRGWSQIKSGLMDRFDCVWWIGLVFKTFFFFCRYSYMAFPMMLTPAIPVNIIELNVNWIIKVL